MILSKITIGNILKIQFFSFLKFGKKQKLRMSIKFTSWPYHPLNESFYTCTKSTKDLQDSLKILTTFVQIILNKPAKQAWNSSYIM